MTAIVLDDFNPRRLVSANRRIHHMVRAEVCAYWRLLGYEAVRDQLGIPPTGSLFKRAHMTVTFRWPDQRRRDGLNLYPYVVKPLVDGMTDANLLPDDDDRHLVGPDFRRDFDRGPHRITIRIEETP